MKRVSVLLFKAWSRTRSTSRIILIRIPTANYGNNAPGNSPNDTVSRFALYYTDRLKMLIQPPIPQVVFFYNQLGGFSNMGKHAAKNQNDNYNYGIAVSPAAKRGGVAVYRSG